jgi:hypothetical protein
VSVTADRLLTALWKDESLLRETLSLLTPERIALPWRRGGNQDWQWAWERRSVAGFVVAECAKGVDPFARWSVRVPSDKVGDVSQGVGKIEAEVKAEADASLHRRGWILVDLPTLGPWEPVSTGRWARKTAIGGTVAWIRPVLGEPRRFTMFVVLDETVTAFEGTEEKAKSIVDRNLEHFGFKLDGSG